MSRKRRRIAPIALVIGVALVLSLAVTPASAAYSSCSKSGKAFSSKFVVLRPIPIGFVQCATLPDGCDAIQGCLAGAQLVAHSFYEHVGKLVIQRRTVFRFKSFVIYGQWENVATGTCYSYSDGAFELCETYVQASISRSEQARAMCAAGPKGLGPPINVRVGCSMVVYPRD